MLSKNVNDKKCIPELIFFNEKKIEKDSDNFLRRKFTLKVKYWHFFTPPYFDIKILYPTLENSITCISILNKGSFDKRSTMFILFDKKFF